MRIGEAAAAAELTPRALRYYEQRGLLATRRNPSGHREYDQQDLHRLRIVRELLVAGLTIADVQDLVALFDMPVPTDTSTGCPVVDVTLRRLADLDERIQRLTEARERLAGALNHRFGDLFSRLERGSEKAA